MIEQCKLNGRTLASILKRSTLPRTSTAFLAATSDCTNASRQPHPVQARQAGITPAWKDWAAWVERGVRRPMAEEVLTNVRYSFLQNVRATEEGLRDDPIWENPTVIKHGDINYLTSISIAPLMFWQRRHALIEMTPALEELLARSDLGDDIPLDQLRPPMPACYLRFGDAIQNAICQTEEGMPYSRIEGVYVFEAVHEGKRTVSFVTMYETGSRIGVSGIEINIHNEQRTINDAITEVCARNHEGGSRHQQEIVQLCTKILLYWKMEQQPRVMETPHSAALEQLRRVGPKKAAKLRRHVDSLYDRILLGPSSLPAHSHAVGLDKSPHWRCGHFRMQPHGPQFSLRKVIFVAPILVRADRLLDDAKTLTPRRA